ncbi:MAG: hypothetical protein EPN21_02670 [Methylococcaceae bacterium]|nr:MAG: hypothetical protein EPN21_02670 [Methylococcaceae bacterium]
MMHWLPLALLAPAISALLIGVGHLGGLVDGEDWESATARIAQTGAALSLLAGLTAWTGTVPASLHLGNWLSSGDFHIGIDFCLDKLSLGLSCLFALLCLTVMRFSVNYMHRESGYHRYFFVLSLFSTAMQLLVTAGNGALAFIGWELAGLCSYLLIAYFHERDNATLNATRAFVTNRLGDAGFVAGLALAYLWLGGIDWNTIAGAATRLGDGQRLALALCFILAAIAKSAQVPLAPWLARAMEGPTPSSAVFYGAVMVHAGVYLLLRLEPLLAATPGAMGLLVVVGLATALYGFIAGLAQTDVKSALVFAAGGQLGLMFIECGLGWWELAAWHLAAHAVLRGYQFLTAPSYLAATHGLTMRPAPRWLARHDRLYVAALQRFWLEAAGDWIVTVPLRRLARDLKRFDARVIGPVIGLPQPALRALSSLAQWEERRVNPTDPVTDLAQAPGLLGRLAQRLTALLHHFEEHWVLKGVGEGLARESYRLGLSLNRMDEFLAQPRYVALMMIIILLMVL